MQDNFQPIGGQTASINVRPAERQKRFIAFLVDTAVCLVPMIVAVPFVIGGAAMQGDGGDANPIAMMMMFGPMILALLFILVVSIYQFYLLATTGQTIGKRMQQIRIVCVDGTRADWVKTIILRSFVTNFASQFTGGLLGLVDPFFIFREDHRCVHDHIAGTVVVDA
jgi:uncharacterized RDD family membrane protein YckC